jgi:hypothetical protein
MVCVWRYLLFWWRDVCFLCLLPCLTASTANKVGWVLQTRLSHDTPLLCLQVVHSICGAPTARCVSISLVQVPRHLVLSSDVDGVMPDLLFLHVLVGQQSGSRCQNERICYQARHCRVWVMCILYAERAQKDAGAYLLYSCRGARCPLFLLTGGGKSVGLCA